MGQFGTPCSFQFIFGNTLNKHKKLHSSPQKSKPRARACLEDESLDQLEKIGPNIHLEGKLRPWVLTSVMRYLKIMLKTQKGGKQDQKSIDVMKAI